MYLHVFFQYGHRLNLQLSIIDMGQSFRPPLQDIIAQDDASKHRPTRESHIDCVSICDAVSQPTPWRPGTKPCTSPLTTYLPPFSIRVYGLHETGFLFPTMQQAWDERAS